MRRLNLRDYGDTLVNPKIAVSCVADPGITCDAPYLDAPTTASNTDGATLRSASCPGTPDGACRPDYIPGAELTGELVVDWPIVRGPVGGPFPPPDPDPGTTCFSGEYKICHVNASIELDVTAPGVTVTNPVIVLDSTSPEFDGTSNDCRCISDPTFEAEFEGEQIGRVGNDDEDWWYTRNVGATCDVALEYSEFIQRDIDLIRTIGETAFPDLLCPGSSSSPCETEATPVFVEPDGSLTKGCGTPPDGTFLIRFAFPNEPLHFVEKPVVGGAVPTATGDLDEDGARDLVSSDTGQVLVNDGSNAFGAQASGLSGSSVSPALVDWTDDGHLDLVVDEAGAGFDEDVRVYPGDGSGTFSSAGSFLIATNAANTNNGTFRIQSADFNADGLPDAFFDTEVWYNQGGGPISPAVDFTVFDDESSGLADLDGDTLLDVLAGTETACCPALPIVQWSENGGPGAFTSQTLLTLPEADELAPVIAQSTVDALECDPFGNDCCSGSRTPGCQDPACEAAVCAEDSFCCNGEWTDSCGQLARDICSVCLDPALPDCCDAVQPQAGCEIPACEAIVCDMDSFCCDTSWDSFCLEIAERYCDPCRTYDVTCQEPVVRRATGADVDGDGDTDLVLALEVLQYVEHPRNLVRPRPTYLSWLPNRQVEDPVTAGGDPLFDPALSPWEPIGPGSADLVLADIDGDGDPDLVGQAEARGYWYRNDAGSFTGPHAIKGPVVLPGDPELTGYRGPVLVADLDGDTTVDAIVSDTVYAPEPGGPLGLALGVLLLARLHARRRTR